MVQQIFRSGLKMSTLRIWFRRIIGCYLLESITVFIPTLPNHGSIYANSINGIIANPFQTYTEHCPNGTAGYFSLNYLALRILQPIPKLEIMKGFQDFIWPTKQINKTLVKLALIGKKKIRFKVSKLVVGSGEQNNKEHVTH